MAVVKVTMDNFENEVLNSDKKVLVDFWASWCGPCMMIAPVIDEISSERTDVKVCKVNVDEEPALAQAFGIESIPTLFVVENGEVVNSLSGAAPKATISGLL